MNQTPKQIVINNGFCNDLRESTGKPVEVLMGFNHALLKTSCHTGTTFVINLIHPVV